MELIWAGLLPGQPCSHPRSVNELGTGEPHTFQLGSLQRRPGAYRELLMEGAGFVLIRTSFQLPSVQALQPLSGQPRPPTPSSLQPSFATPSPHELGCAVSGAALLYLWRNPGALCVAGMYRVAFLESSLSF